MPRPAGLAHALVGWPIFLFHGFWCFVVLTLIQLLAWPFDRHIGVRLGARVWGRTFYWTQPAVRLALHGFDRELPAPCMIVSNHASVLDIPAAMTLPVPLRVVGKTSLFEVPLMGWYMRFSRQIPLDAEDPESVEAMLASVKDALASGVSVLIFPEGTRSVDGTLGPFNRGAFRLAKDLDVPLLPIVVEGTRDIMPKGRLRAAMPQEAVTVQVLDPVDPGTFTTARKLSNTVRRGMESALVQLQPQQVK